MSNEVEQKQDILQPEGQAGEQVAPQEPEQSAQQEANQPQDPAAAQIESFQQTIAQQEDRYLRLAAEYDNYRKRTAKEKQTVWQEVRGETAAAFFPVFDNLERAVNQPTTDEAYKKGVEMTMNQLKEVFAQLQVTEIEALGLPFDPNLHNAVMHVEHESQEENTVGEVFQAGFRCGDKILRHAMVAVVK